MGNRMPISAYTLYPVGLTSTGYKELVQPSRLTDASRLAEIAHTTPWVF